MADKAREQENFYMILGQQKRVNKARTPKKRLLK